MNKDNFGVFSDSILPEHEIDKNPIPLWMRWIRTSPDLIIDAERKLLNRLRSTIQTFFVPIFGNTCAIRTLIAENFPEELRQRKNKPIPLVLVHGFASGLGLWCKNLDALAAHRPVYAFDLLGFGRSSRPSFSEDAEEVELQFVNSLEEWRSALKLEKFILVGHSLGGYLSYSYAIANPQRIAHLILVDPWGFKEAPFDEESVLQNRKRAWLFRTVRGMLRSSNPLSILRAIGPFGRAAINYFRQDLIRAFDQQYLASDECLEIPTEIQVEAAGHERVSSFDSPVDSEHTANGAVNQSDNASSPNDSKPSAAAKACDPRDLDGSAALDYVYHINVQRPSGEVGFKALCTHIGWAKRPMLKRVEELDRIVPITFIYGSRSWMDMSSGITTRDLRSESYVDVKIIEGAGHQVYAQAADEFNAYVNLVAHRVDAGFPFDPVDPSKPENLPDIVVSKRSTTDETNTKRHQTSSKLNNFFFPKYPNEPPSITPLENCDVPDTSDESSY